MYDAQEELSRFWTNLVARPSGPLAFRFMLQPLVTTLFAIRDGIRDAQTGRSPYFWTVLRDPLQRRQRLKEGLRATAKIVAFGVAVDALYQFSVLNGFYPGEAIIVALFLGFVPYLLVRGPVNRIARLWTIGRRER
jgi:hypothetical protein